MTVTPLHARSSTRFARRGRISPWSLTIEITVDGDLDDDTLAVLQDLQRLATRPATPSAARHLDSDLIRIHPDSRAAIQGTRTLALSRLEFDLLLFFAENPGRVFTREHLLTRVWGCADRTIDRTVDVHIRRLRAKAGEVPLITTVRGIGYRLADDARLLVVHG
jgi:DNA-binding response OmpR family regulator